MLEATKYGLGNLFNFKGRDARQTFWFYALFVYLIMTVISFLAMIPAIAHLFSAVFEAAKTGADAKTVDGFMPGFMSEMMASILWVSIGSSLGMAALLAASLVRRLHDSDMSGWWALIPAAVQIFAMVQLPRQIAQLQAVFKDMEPSRLNQQAAMMQMQGTGLVGWIAVGLVIWFGVRKSSEGPNRFGAAPVSF